MKKKNSMTIEQSIRLCEFHAYLPRNPCKTILSKSQRSSDLIIARQNTFPFLNDNINQIIKIYMILIKHNLKLALVNCLHGKLVNFHNFITTMKCKILFSRFQIPWCINHRYHFIGNS